jgi:hypothetical protein
VQPRQGAVDALGVGVGALRPHRRVAEQAAAQLRHPPVVVHARLFAAAFDDPGGRVATPAPLLDHQQLAHHSGRRIRGPRGEKPLAR